MYPLIAIFYISLLGIVAMILLKRREIISGRATAVSNFGRRSDRFFQWVWAGGSRFMTGFNRQTFIALSQWLAYHILFQVREVYVELKHRALMNPHGRKLIDAVRGRGEINNHGVSFYLRRIGEK